MVPVEATYLAWIDVRDLQLANPAAHFEAHGIGLSDGSDFGAPGWLRLNFGCPRSTLDEALRRFGNACQAASGRP
jgi:cystathionine beta-lyase